MIPGNRASEKCLVNKLRIGAQCNPIVSGSWYNYFHRRAYLLDCFTDADQLSAVLFAINIAAHSPYPDLIARNLPARIKLMTKAMNGPLKESCQNGLLSREKPKFPLLADNFNAMMEQLSGAIKKVHPSLTELRKISATIGQLSEKRGFLGCQYETNRCRYQGDKPFHLDLSTQSGSATPPP